MKMELIEGSETSAIRTKTPGNYPKENTLHIAINALEFLFEDVSVLVRPTGYEQIALEWTV